MIDERRLCLKYLYLVSLAIWRIPSYLDLSILGGVEIQERPRVWRDLVDAECARSLFGWKINKSYRKIKQMNWESD